MKNWQEVFGVLGNIIWIGCEKFFLLLREYLSSTVNVLTNSPSISDLTNRDICKLNSSYNDGGIG